MKRILIIDDTEHVREFIREALEGKAYEILVAEDGAQGLAIFAAEHLDLVITDIIMTNIDGLTVIREIRQLSSKVPILAISGGSPDFRTDHLLDIARLVGANAVLFKPFDLEQLLATIERLLEK